MVFGKSNKEGPKEAPGVITVMLAMTLFLILSLVLVSLESARISCERSMLTMELQTALESVAGEYYAPLFDEYGIYGLYGIDIEDAIQEYLTISEQVTKNALSEGSVENGLFAQDVITSVTCSDRVNLLSGGGVLVKNQMVTDGAVVGAEAIAEKLLSAANLLTDTEETGKVVSAKLAAEQQLAGMDLLLVKLMVLLDGAPVSEGGFTYDERGNLIGNSLFLKRMVYGRVTMDNVAIDKQLVYDLAEPYCQNVVALVMNLQEQVEAAKGNGQGIPVEELMPKLINLQALLQYTENKYHELAKLLPSLVSYQNKVAPLVDNFDKTLALGKDYLGDELYSQYATELQKMKRYVSLTIDGKGYDFSAMTKAMQKNLARVETALAAITELMHGNPADLSAWEVALRAVDSSLNGYSLEAFRMDYSGITGKIMTYDDSLWNAVKSFLENGIDGYLLGDLSSVSNSILLDENLPSEDISGEESELFSYKSIAIEDLADTESLNRYLKSEELSGSMKWLRDTAGAIGEKMLLVSYVSQHFANYTDKEQDGVLAYEQEYILFGSLKDRTNVRRAAMSIFGLRSIVNVVYALTDPTLNAEALKVAGSLAEICPFAAAIIQYAVLIAIGLENALLETIELLQGKVVPLIESTRSFQTKVSDLAGIGKTAMQNRATAYQGSTTFGLDYSQYLLLFLLAKGTDKIVYRSMDLIQGNMQLKDSEFRLRDCVYSFGVTVEAQGRSVYTRISFGDGLKASEEVSYSVKGAFAY